MNQQALGPLIVTDGTDVSATFKPGPTQFIFLIGGASETIKDELGVLYS
jgi:hypothetical protein